MSTPDTPTPTTPNEFDTYMFPRVWAALAAEALATTQSKGFMLDKVNPLEQIALMHAELSEAVEGVRKSLMDSHLPHRSSLEVELADCVIRIMSFTSHQGLDLAGAIVEKMAYNKGREHLHGNKSV